MKILQTVMWGGGKRYPVYKATTKRTPVLQMREKQFRKIPQRGTEALAESFERGK